jgi:hypothetical protein
VECTLGILKEQWRILKSGVRLHGVDPVDYVWSTCFALHNWLLDIVGLSDKWVGDVRQSEWDGELDCLDFEGMRVLNLMHLLVCH